MVAKSKTIMPFALVLFIVALAKAFIDRAHPQRLTDLAIVILMVAVIMEQLLREGESLRIVKPVKIVSFVVALVLLIVSGWIAR